MAKPETREKILDEQSDDHILSLLTWMNLTNSYPMPDKQLFEPDPSESLGAVAQLQGVIDVSTIPGAIACFYDELVTIALDTSCTGFLSMYLSGYANGNLDAIRTLLMHPDTILGASDGGAHVNVMCDASYPSFVLQHFVRDRTRGEKIPLAAAVQLLSAKPARVYGLDDRGTLEVGKKADLNIIDLDALQLQMPRLVDDLPSNSERILQAADGFVATIVSGEVTFRNGVHTGAKPGRLLRGRRPATAVAA